MDDYFIGIDFGGSKVAAGIVDLKENSPAHIKASIIGSSRVIFIQNGQPVLGTWQGIYFLEFDGPRQRYVLIKILKDQT
jgi:secondary thiamine-phosphate synthase enzyme